MISILRTIAPAALLFACAVPAHAQNLLINGSFDLGPDPGARMTVPVASTAIQGWTVNGAPIEYIGTAWAALHGPRSVALNGANAGAIAQSFATVNGAPYSVKFFLSGDPAVPPYLKNVRVSAAGQQQDYAFDSEHVWEWGMGWLPFTFAFNANATNTTLTFTSLNAGANGPAIDSVVVTGPSPVDAPTYPLVGFELAAPRPNPGAGAFAISFAVPEASGDIRLSVLDARGREVRVLAAGPHHGGTDAHWWDGRTDAGVRAMPGVYFVRLLAPSVGVSIVKKGVLLP